MKLLFDLQAAQNGSRDRGIGRYAKSLFNALSKRKDIELFALLNGSIGDTFEAAKIFAAERVGADRVFVFPGLSSTSEKYPNNKFRRKLGEALYEAFVDQAGCDALLVGSLVEGLHDDTCNSLSGFRTDIVRSTVLYDLIPFANVEQYLPSSMEKNWYFDRIRNLNYADVLLAISEYSGKEAEKFLKRDPRGIAVISTAIDDGVFNQGVGGEAVMPGLGIHKPYIMHASVIDPRKNFDGLVKAYARLPVQIRSKYQLVLVGMVASDMEVYLRRIASEAGVPDADLVMPGFVEDEDLLRLYRSCSLFVFPSYYEGFGLPALEAMACGCPTIGSNVSSIPEVIGDAAYTFDPANDAEMARLIQHLLSDKVAHEAAKEHAKKHAAAFSWDMVADRAVNAIRSVLAERNLVPAAPQYPSAERMAAHVAARVDIGECPVADVEAMAGALAVSEDELMAKWAALHPKEKPWRVEGPPFDTSYSLALVSRETARSMSNIGWEVALQSGEGQDNFPVSQGFLADNPDLAVMYQRASESSQQTSFAVSRLNYPPRVADMYAPINALHHYAWEETGFPQQWVDDFNNHLTVMTTLSTHIEKLMIDNGVSVPMATSGCGVDHWDRIKPDESFRVEARGFRFLHVSSCFPRKGVEALLAAYESAFTNADDVTLVIKTFDNPHNTVRETLAEMRAKNSRFPDVVTIIGDLTDAEVKSIYSQCDVMVGPSFAEGYGLPFAEAMLSGIPVITTNWGGQLDFCNPGNSWLVDYQFERANTHFGLWTSAWARVHVHALADAMREARATSPQIRAEMAARGREQLLARHQWRHVAQRLTVATSTLPALAAEEPKIGWISTWNSKCGIATYSQHLIENMPGKVTVFSPEREATLIGPDDSLRLWRQSKSLSRLDRIFDSEAARETNVFVIQFNFGFYNHSDLQNFVFRAKALGKSVIICLHSTYLPWEPHPAENFQLSWLLPALAACDRVMVHSIDDLNRLKALGLVDNVALFPHGVLRRQDNVEDRPCSKIPTIATYGFALPHKGLLEVLDALRILHERGQKVRLKMVNAEYPVEHSGELIAELRARVHHYGLKDYVEIHSEFLSDAESLELLTDSDLIVFAYQNTSESASGAVRYGMAVERPVAVTPLPIFSDVEGTAFRFQGTSASAIAEGIGATFDAIANRTPAAIEIAERAARWREQHDYRSVGRRLYNICKAVTMRSKITSV